MHNAFRRIFLAGSLILLAALPALSQEFGHPARSFGPLDFEVQPFDVLHYAPVLDLRNAPGLEMSGVCTITLLWRDTTDRTFRFHLRDLTIDSIHYQARNAGSPSEVSHQTLGTPDDADYHHAIDLSAESPSAGDTVDIVVHYHGSMTNERGNGSWGGVSSGNGVLYALGVGFTNNYVSATQHWMPCYDHPSDKATFTGTFRIPAELEVASNGLMVSKVEETDGSQTWTWDHIHPAATYLLTFAVADYVTIELGTPELPMPIYTSLRDSSLTHTTFSLLPEMVSWFVEHYGPYPFEKVGFANTPQGAMEHQTMVSFSTIGSRSGDPVNLTGAHELSHQWFGDLVSPKDFRHAWLTESFSEFNTALWLEKENDYAGYLAEVTSNLNLYFQGVVPSEGVLPLYDFPRAAPSSNYPGTIYVMGMVVVGMLRFELGETGFFSGIRAYLDSFAYSSATTEDLMHVLEASSGRDLSRFFDQWVYRAGWPIYEIDAKVGSPVGDVRLTFTQVQPKEDGLFSDVPVEVGFQTASGVKNRIIRIDSAEQTFRFNIGEEVLNIFFNEGPSMRTLAEFELFLSSVDQQGSADVPRPVDVRMMGGTTGPIVIERNGKSPLSDVTLQLYDSVGKVLLSELIPSYPHIVQVEELPSGNYVLSLSEGTHLHTFPVLIQR